jgi:hypothetical protein
MPAIEIFEGGREPVGIGIVERGDIHRIEDAAQGRNVAARKGADSAGPAEPTRPL